MNSNYTSVSKMKNTFSDGDRVKLISDDLRLNFDCLVIGMSIREHGASPIVVDEDTSGSVELPETA